MLRRLRGVSVACFAPAKRASGIAAAALLLATLAGGCTRIELENKAEAYDAAISESSNELILLNAVRASQRAPMSRKVRARITPSGFDSAARLK